MTGLEPVHHALEHGLPFTKSDEPPAQVVRWSWG